jgi:hypothetical protein
MELNQLAKMFELCFQRSDVFERSGAVVDPIFWTT